MSSVDAVYERAERVHLIRILPEEACARLIARAEAAGVWEDSPCYSESVEGFTVDYEYRISRSVMERDRPDLFADVRPAVERTFAKFIAADASPRFILSRFELIRYEPGGMFLAHRDSVASEAWRRYSIVAYLNDEFEGGATAFPTIERTLRPRRGQGILFPSLYLHGGEQVSSGRKYVMTGYLGDPETAPDWF
jgi:hypothetical protein